MQTLQLEKKEAQSLFKIVPEWFQKTLISSFGNETFAEKITDRIKSFVDAYAEADDETRRIYDMSVTSPATEDELAYKQLKLIIKVVNEDWTADWNNSDQKKWYPWFELSSSPSGVGFSHSDYFCTGTYASVGSRLCFATKEKCEYVVKQFIDLYKQFLLIN